MTIRKATIDDAHFIALVVVEALGDDIMLRNEDGICNTLKMAVKLKYVVFMLMAMIKNET